MKTRILLVFLCLVLLVPSPAFAVQSVGYWGSDKGTTMWAEAGAYAAQFYIRSIELEGRGSGYIKTVNMSGSGEQTIPVELNGDSKTFTFKANGAKLTASSGKFWCVTIESDNPNGTGICDRPSDWQNYLNTGSGEVTWGEAYLPDQDVVKITYKGWSDSTTWYQLHFNDHTGSYTSDPIRKTPTGIHYLTCNGTYRIKFYDSKNNVVSQTTDIKVSSIKNPTCSSFEGDPTGGNDGGGDTGGGACDCCDEIKQMVGSLDAAVKKQGYDLSDLKAMSRDLQTAVNENGYKLDALDRAVENMANTIGWKLDEVNSNLGKVNNKLDRVNDNLEDINDSLTPSSKPILPNPNWDSLSKQSENSTLNQINKVTDNNVYFTDPGEGPAVPGMPVQPAENYPVPIGKSFDKQQPLNQQPSLSRQDPKTSQPPLNVQPPLSVDQMKPDPVPNRTPMQQSPAMKPDPVMKQDHLQADPSLDRTNFYERK